MYLIKKEFTVQAAHKLSLSYDSKCTNLHGHAWEFTVYMKSHDLNGDSMVADFTHIKHAIQDKLDHQYLNDIFDFNTTSERIARWTFDTINELFGQEENHPICYRVDVQEAEGSLATYVED